MDQIKDQVYSVSEFVGLLNQNMEYSYPDIFVTGEVSSFKVNQNKWVFFDIKDSECSLNCFMTIYQLKAPIQDGMLVKVCCTPKLTNWGKFSLTIKSIELAGEGSIKKSFEILHAKLEKEGLFLDSKKRTLPTFPKRIGLITSKQAAAYNDFVTIINQRWSGLAIDHVQVQVQGESAADQIISALEYFGNKSDLYDIIVITRGGGSMEDMQAFNTEPLVRAVSGSKVPTVVAIGHEDDISLAELAADQRATTPTNAAQLVTPDKTEQSTAINNAIKHMVFGLESKIMVQQKKIEEFSSVFSSLASNASEKLNSLISKLFGAVDLIVVYNTNLVNSYQQSLKLLDPSLVLKRGYSLIRLENAIISSVNQINNNDIVDIQFTDGTASARVMDTNQKRRRDDKSK
ncbi:MAG TPA: exodeoxyribonuclease VII large subunit [Candidatus Saccharibacteria bacterium]|nr:exodeoxyribonuclease VII large subunit [Candidatus Saccharibacteria bacterium]HMT39321.1 exodeoxyribonuclease VII large subunit [Candidatus Saccharibacteria bacterium]